MKSKKAETLLEITKITENNNHSNYVGVPFHYVSLHNAKEAIEIAEAERDEYWRKKAIEAFEEIAWMIGWAGCSSDEAEKKFTQKLEEVNDARLDNF